MDTWALGLIDITSEELACGLRACVSSGEAWPPSLPEFRALCRPLKIKRENAEAYRYPGPSLPHLLSDEARQGGRAMIAEMRQKLEAWI